MFAPFKLPAVFIPFSIAIFIGCQKPKSDSQNGSISVEKTQDAHIPGWLQAKIKAFENEKPANPPVKIFRYVYQHQPVYFITGRCCDIPGTVYSVEGQEICQPDGGITGRGDGKCTDFFTTRTEEKLIWEDLRK